MTNSLNHCLIVPVLLALAACSPQQQETSSNAPAPTASPASIAPVATDVPAGAYTLDKAHASLLFRVNHLGFSHYTARFKRFDAQLQFDPANPAASRLSATVDARSLETDYPDPTTLDFNLELQGKNWLNTAQFPEMTFRSTAVESTGDRTMRVKGDFTLRGVTRPLVLEATFNGGYAGHLMDPNARIGFSARGALNRSEFGVSFGIPSAGSSMGVSNEVEIIIEAEFSGPPFTPPADVRPADVQPPVVQPNE